MDLKYHNSVLFFSKDTRSGLQESRKCVNTTYTQQGQQRLPLLKPVFTYLEDILCLYVFLCITITCWTLQLPVIHKVLQDTYWPSLHLTSVLSFFKPHMWGKQIIYFFFSKRKKKERNYMSLWLILKYHGNLVLQNEQQSKNNLLVDKVKKLFSPSYLWSKCVYTLYPQRGFLF